MKDFQKLSKNIQFQKCLFQPQVMVKFCLGIIDYFLFFGTQFQIVYLRKRWYKD